MSLKLLMIPLSILTVLILMIGFVKPDITTLFAKQTTYATKLDQVKNRDTLLANIRSLRASVESQGEAERFAQNYFPKAMDQGRVIDALNFLASQSGVAVILMDLKEGEAVGKSAEPIPGEEEVVGQGTSLGSVFRVTPVKSFSVRVTVKGRYENIKEFFGRVAHVNRIHRTRNFSLVAPQGDKTKVSTTEETGILSGYFEADFDYFDAQTGVNAFSAPVFSDGAFDMDRLSATSSWVTSTVPSLEKPQSGRPNPFQ